MEEITVQKTNKLDAIAKSPVEFVWHLLMVSIQGALGANPTLEKILNALLSLVAIILAVPAISFFIGFKATQISLNVTSGTIKLTAGSISARRKSKK